MLKQKSRILDLCFHPIQTRNGTQNLKSGLHDFYHALVGVFVMFNLRFAESRKF